MASLFSLPGVGTYSVLPDWLHVVELGVSQDAAGNVLWECIHKDGVFPGASQKIRLSLLNDELKLFNAELKPGNPLHQITMRMIKLPDQSPKLKCKGAESRGLRPFIVRLAKKLLMHNPDEAHIKMVVCIDALVVCSTVVDKEPFCLKEFQRSGDAFLAAYQWLSQHYAEEGLWRYKPKHHLFHHLLHDIADKHGSPNTYWCWADESLAGQFAKAALRRGGRATGSHMSKSLMDRVSSLGWVQ